VKRTKPMQHDRNRLISDNSDPNKKRPVSIQTTGLQHFSCFGNPAVLRGPVAFRPTIARGLALSNVFLILPADRGYANTMPR